MSAQTVRVTYDRKADALYVYLVDRDVGQARSTQEVERGCIMVDRDEQGHALGVEILLPTDSVLDFQERP